MASSFYDDARKVFENDKKYIEIPKGATNGDIIKAMFPDAHDWIVRHTIEGDALGEDEVSHFLELPNNLIINRFTEDWWNAPYEGER